MISKVLDWIPSYKTGTNETLNTQTKENLDHPVEFICEDKHKNAIPEPVPSYKEFPEWYKETPFFQEEGQIGFPQSGSVKRCMAVKEGLSAGWIVKTPENIKIEISNEGMNVNYNLNNTVQDFTNDLMNETYPDKILMLKIKTHWNMIGDEGWAMLVRNLPNRPNNIFKSTTGIVDLSGKPIPINPIIIWKDFNFNGVIEKGTPLAQLIPIKKDVLKDEYKTRTMTPEEKRLLDRRGTDNKSNKHHYREEVWEPIHRARKPSENQ